MNARLAAKAIIMAMVEAKTMAMAREVGKVMGMAVEAARACQLLTKLHWDEAAPSVGIARTKRIVCFGAKDASA